MSEVTNIVSEAIQRRRLFRPGERILVAVSGGLDSMVLLHMLHALAKHSGWRLTIAHLNHQLRGQSSNADERLVRRTAGSLGVPVVIERADVRKLARTLKLSLEMAARKVRHEFLARTAIRLGLGVVALAHHADDQLELFFLRLLRGSGAQALSGMKWRSPSPVAPAVPLVRPLLDLPKTALREYAALHKIAFREDTSNTCLDILRNRIRHQLLPLLKTKYQPALGDVVRRTVEVAGSESEFVELSAVDWLCKLEKEARRPKGSADSRSGRESELRGFEDLHVAVQRRVIQVQLIKLGIVPDYQLVEKLRSKPERRVAVTRVDRRNVSVSQKPLRSAGKQEGFVFQDRAGLLRLIKGPAGLGLFAPEVLPLELKGSGGSVEFSGLRLRWKFTNGTLAPKLKRLRDRELFDAEKVGGHVILRHWRPGDRFQPIGMPTSVKLQDLYTNQKIPAATRRRLVLATTTDGEVFWAEGLRISERFKLTSQTIRRLHWAWERL